MVGEGSDSRNGWMVRYDDLIIDGGGTMADCPEFAGMTVIGILNAPPDGISGWGELRTSDITYVGRDGVKFGQDYYDVRQVTLTLSIGPESCCAGDQDPKWAVKELLKRWHRRCEDIPLIVYPPGCDECCDPDDPFSPHPVQLTGRPRVAQVSWQRSFEPLAEVTLRFDANRVMELTNCCGTPGSGEQCVDLRPGLSLSTRCYDDCAEGYRCYSHEMPETNPFQEQEIVQGTECVCPIITATGLLVRPRWTNRQTGGRVTYRGEVPEGATLTIDTCEGIAMMGGNNVSRHLLIEGDLRMQPGEESDWIFVSFGPNDTGTSRVCWQPGSVTV